MGWPYDGVNERGALNLRLGGGSVLARIHFPSQPYPKGPCPTKPRARPSASDQLCASGRQLNCDSFNPFTSSDASAFSAANWRSSSASSGASERIVNISLYRKLLRGCHRRT